MTDLELIQFMLLFCVALMFTAFGVSRKGALSYLLAGIAWIASGLVNFTFNPVGALPAAVSYIFVAVGVIFLVATFVTIGDALLEQKHEKRWRFGIQ